MIYYRIAMMCISGVVLTACGGGGGNGGGGVPNNGKPALSYLELGELSNVRDERVEDKFYATPGTQNEFRDKARTLNMPSAGTANYNGEAWITVGEGVPVVYEGEQIENAPQVAGQGTLKADFVNKTLNGTITDFVPAPGHTSTGAKARFSGRIDGNRVDGSWKGSVNFDGVTHEFEKVKHVRQSPSERQDSEGSFIGDGAAALYLDGEGVTSRGDKIAVESFFEKNGTIGK